MLKYSVSGKYDKLEDLPSNIQEVIHLSLKNNTPIIIRGEQGPIGKTSLTNLLRENGVQAWEKWECIEIEVTRGD